MAVALLVGGGSERQAAVTRALGRARATSVAVDDAVGAMAALGRAPFTALVVLATPKSAAVPLRALFRVARHRHPGIAFVVLRGPREAGEDLGPRVAELPLDAGADEIAAAAAPRAPAPVEDATAPEQPARGPLLEGALAGGGGGPAVLASIYAQELTGRLHVDEGPARGILWFAGGEPVAVDDDDGDVRTGAGSASEALAAHRARVRARVCAFIEQQAGTYTFVEDRDFLDVRLLTRVSPFGLILDVRRRQTTPASLLSQNAELAGRWLSAGAGLERAGARLVQFTRGRNIADEIGAGVTVEELLARVGLDPLMGTLVVLTLVDAGLVALHDEKPRPGPVPLGALDDAPNPFSLDGSSVVVDNVPEATEKVARLYLEMKPVTDPHLLLGVPRGATPAEIEDAYRTRMAALQIDGPGIDQRLDELRRKAEQARIELLQETQPMPPAPRERRATARERLGRYEIIGTIGAGGMAEVFLGRSVGPRGFEKRVVIKKVLPEYADNKDVVRMFLEEARIAARITHPNVVQIYDLGESEGEYYIVMEHVDGMNVERLLVEARHAQREVPFPIAAAIVASTCAGLHAAHTHKDDGGRPVPIIHRDVSTQNVLVGRDGHVKLTDFGVAKRADALDKTMPGILKGKPHYLAPEYIMGAPADARSDVFAAGLVLYVCITGEHPFERMTADESMRAVLAGSWIPVARLRPDVPRSLAHIVDRALAKDVEQRFQSAQALQLALESFCAASGQMPTPSLIAGFVAAATAPEEPAPASFDEQTLELTWPFSDDA